MVFRALRHSGRPSRRCRGRSRRAERRLTLDRAGTLAYRRRSRDQTLVSSARTGAWVAQLVEQRIENPRVGGSIPPPGTTFPAQKQQAHCTTVVFAVMQQKFSKSANAHRHASSAQAVSCVRRSITPYACSPGGIETLDAGVRRRQRGCDCVFQGSGKTFAG